MPPMMNLPLSVRRVGEELLDDPPSEERVLDNARGSKVIPRLARSAIVDESGRRLGSAHERRWNNAGRATSSWCNRQQRGAERSSAGGCSQACHEHRAVCWGALCVRHCGRQASYHSWIATLRQRNGWLCAAQDDAASACESILRRQTLKFCGRTPVPRKGELEYFSIPNFSVS